MQSGQGDSGSLQENGPTDQLATAVNEEQRKENERLQQEIEELKKNQETVTQQLAEKDTQLEKLVSFNLTSYNIVRSINHRNNLYKSCVAQTPSRVVNALMNDEGKKLFLGEKKVIRQHLN